MYKKKIKERELKERRKKCEKKLKKKLKKKEKKKEKTLSQAPIRPRIEAKYQFTSSTNVLTSYYL